MRRLGAAVLVACFTLSAQAAAQRGRARVSVIASLGESPASGPATPVSGHQLAFFRTAGDSILITTDGQGKAQIDLAPGSYRLKSLAAVDWQGYRWVWDVAIAVRPGMQAIRLQQSNAVRIHLFEESADRWEIREQAIHREKVAVQRSEIRASLRRCLAEVEDSSAQRLRGVLESEGYSVGERSIALQDSFVRRPDWRTRVPVVAPKATDHRYEIVREEFSDLVRMVLPVQRSGISSHVAIDLPIHVLAQVSRELDPRARTLKDVKDVTTLTVSPLVSRTNGVAMLPEVTVLDTHVDERPVVLQLRYVGRAGDMAATMKKADLGALLASVRCVRELERLPADLSQAQQDAAVAAIGKQRNPLPAIYQAMTPGKS